MISKRAFCSAAAACLVLLAGARAAAQAPQPTDAPQAKKNPEPVGFRAAPGARVPDAIKLEPMPKVVVDLVPKMADYQYAVVSRQVIIVDPRTNTVVEAISQ